MRYMILLSIVLCFNVGHSISRLTCDTETRDVCIPASKSSLFCVGTGQIFEIPDECMDDGGINTRDDSLEIYCVSNRARFCLSGEACPWRIMKDGMKKTRRTCSRAGLTSPYMANAWCNLWRNHTNFYCCSDGSIGF